MVLKLQYLGIAVLLSFTAGYAHQFAGVDYIIEESISNKNTPGATVIIGNSQRIFYNSAYGHFTYSENSTVVDTNHIFDLASLTKVFATTMCVMKLVDSGLVNIEDKVSTYLPDFAQNGKTNVLIRHCLLHTSGLPAYYSPGSSQTPGQIIAAIYRLSLSNPIGSTYLYSCLNFVTLMKVVEAITGKAMWEFYGDIFTEPLGMLRTMFCPPDSIKNQCLPTSTSSGYQGIVHDPLARGLDGYSGNAGLFSTSGDLAKICRLLLNNGRYAGKQYISPSTVALFTTQYSSSSSRALGWGTNAYGAGSAGSLLSSTAYGHTGYTGTSVWCDPEKDLFVVLLTNRVYPDDNASITSTRAKVADAAVRAVEGIPPQPTLNYLKNNDDNLIIDWNANVLMGAVEETQVWVDYGDGYSLELSVSTDTSHLSFPIEWGSDSTVLVRLVNRFDTTESLHSDVLVLRGSKKDVLIVDGYDRIGSWGKASHNFAEVHLNSLPDSLGVRSCANEQVINGNVDLTDFKYVIWILADESTSDETFDSDEQSLVIEYFQSGGCLFVSGSEIAWDLDYKGSSGDKIFFNRFLRAKYSGDDSGSLSASGISGTLFEGISFSYGTGAALYLEDYPDYVSAVNGGKVCLKYGNGYNAAICYEGSYNDVGEPGKLVYMGFPFETIVTESDRAQVMHAVIEYFQLPFSTENIGDNEHNLPEAFRLFPAYPNPFNAETTLSFELLTSSLIKLSIYDISGRLVKTIVNSNHSAGQYQYRWDGKDELGSILSCGVYIVRFMANEKFQGHHKVTLLK